MSNKEKYELLKKRNTESYENYRNAAGQWNSRIEKQCNIYKQQISLINKERIDLRDQIRELYYFLEEIGGSLDRKITIFDYKIEVPISQKDYSGVLELHNPQYMKHHYLEDGIPSHIRKHNENVDMIKNFELDLEKQDNKYLEDLLMKKRFYDEMQTVVNIATIYRDVVIIVRDAIRYKIIPEMDYIRAFMYADSINEKVVSEEPLEDIRPCPIIEYKNSRFDKHYQFVKNAFDFYEISTSFFQAAILTDMLEDEVLSEQEQRDFECKINELKECVGCINEASQVTEKNEEFDRLEYHVKIEDNVPVDFELWGPKQKGQDFNFAFRMEIEDVFQMSGKGTVVIGKVCGDISINATVSIFRYGGYNDCVVDGIEKNRVLVSEAHDGDNVGILLKNITKKDVSVGDVLVMFD